jgi:putative holliday junction resolvase
MSSKRTGRTPEDLTSETEIGDVSENHLHEEKAGPVLAIDYGRKRIGVAISDELGATAQPLETIQRQNRRKDLQRLREICREYRVTHIVVGHPLHMTGEIGEMAVEAAAFAKRLGKAVDLTVELMDERLTSWEAQQTMAHIKSSSRRDGEPLDDVAAAVLLREYLGQKRRGVRSKMTENI